MRFTDARLKIERAKKHIADIESFISALPDRYTVTIENDPNTGKPALKHDLIGRDTIATDLAVIIGDAVHNLKCALDYAWAQTIETCAPLAVSNRAKFPIFATVEKLENALRGIKIHIAAPALYRLIVSDIKSYQGGNHSLWSIHTLDIRDKHRLLIPVLQMAAISGIQLEDDQGSVEWGQAWGTLEKAPYYIAIEPYRHVKNKGHVSVAIIFNEGTPLYGIDVPDMLSTLALFTLNIVESLENL